MERQEIELLRYKDGKFGGHLRHNPNSSKYVLYLDFSLMLWTPSCDLRLKVRRKCLFVLISVSLISRSKIFNKRLILMKSLLWFSRYSTLLIEFQDWVLSAVIIACNLTNMIEYPDSPHLFFTLSAADLHWLELHKLIEEQMTHFTIDPRVNIGQIWKD